MKKVAQAVYKLKVPHRSPSRSHAMRCFVCVLWRQINREISRSHCHMTKTWWQWALLRGGDYSRGQLSITFLIVSDSDAPCLISNPGITTPSRSRLQVNVIQMWRHQQEFDLTHVGRDKMSGILQITLSNGFFKEMLSILLIFICSNGFNWQLNSISSDNGLAPSRRLVIIWTNANISDNKWRHCATAI